MIALDIDTSNLSNIDIEKLSEKELRKLHSYLNDIARYGNENKINAYIKSRYPWQEKFHSDGETCPQRLLMCANQCGKTICGCSEDVFHLTGIYPEWWKGKKFEHPVNMWVCGATTSKVRDSVQTVLFGDPYDKDAYGTGLVPKRCLEGRDPVKKHLPAYALEVAFVRHHTDGVFDGWSKCSFKAYEMGVQVFTSEQVHVIHLDEEPQEIIMAHCLKRQIAVDGLLYLTFTPEFGWTQIVTQFVNNIQKGQSLTTATWNDVTHLTEERKKQLLDAMPEYMRATTSEGLPPVGSGLIFPVSDDAISFDIGDFPNGFPSAWKYICGMDIGGWNSHTACVWMVMNPCNGVKYVYDLYKAKGGTPPIHAAAINSRGKDILVIYPHDGEKERTFDGTGTGKVAQMYRDLGCNMHYTHFTNPPAEGEEEGEGGISTASGLYVMYDEMITGKLKVASHLKEWFSEKRSYHRRDNKIVRMNEDIMSATRYAALSIERFGMPRYASQRIIPVHNSYFNPYDNSTWS